MSGYGTDEGFAAYAAANGHTVPAGSVPGARARGSAFVDGAYGDRFSGVPTGGIDQDRAWPRSGASAFGQPIDPALVPKRVEHAAYEAALIELATPGSLSAVITGSARVVREKVGELEVQYANPGADAVADATPVVTAIEGLLAPLLRRPGLGVMVV